jgi:hypothetical protein
MQKNGLELKTGSYNSAGTTVCQAARFQTTRYDFMIRLGNALSAWGTPGFEAVLKQEIAQLGAEQLPLQQGLSSSNYVADAPITVMINSVAEMEKVIRVKAGIFYKGVTGGCSCEGDPTTASENTEYCEVQLDIDKATAETAVALVAEQPD